ncbi:MAG: tyrosine-type recombinase/integrase [Trebonia sp.]
MSREPKEATCRSCRSQLGIDETDNANLRLEALFVLSITLGLRPGELRMLTWDHVDLNGGVVHVGRSARRDGDTKTPKSKRSLELPKRAVVALRAHKVRQARERLEAGEAWREHNLVFCHENGARTRPTRSSGASPRCHVILMSPRRSDEVERRACDQGRLSGWVVVGRRPSGCVGSRSWLPAAGAGLVECRAEIVIDYLPVRGPGIGCAARGIAVGCVVWRSPSALV